MFNLRQRFTEWYYRKGYRMECYPNENTVKLIFKCPFWIRPLVSELFSPCAYYRSAGY